MAWLDCFFTIKKNFFKMENKTALWAAAHTMTEEQNLSLEKQGYNVVLLKEENPDLFRSITNLEKDSDREQLARKLIGFSCRFENPTIFQPAGDPRFQFILGQKSGSLTRLGVGLKYAFSKRISEDIQQPDGTVKKIVLFKHEGWI